MALLVVLTLCCFAANSLLARAALGDALLAPGSFTAVRLLAAWITLAAVTRADPRRSGSSSASGPVGLGPPVALFGYAVAFSFAYVRIPAGVGALVLFGAVQVTMIARGLIAGERPRPGEWVGLLLALGGLGALARPGETAPDPAGVGLMALAGVGWGAYSLHGRGVRAPLLATERNFRWCLVPALALLVVGGGPWRGAGVAWAALSGAIATGLGYVIWFAALPALTAARAALLQLAVPVLAAAGGVLLLGETVTGRSVASSAAILGGIALATVTGRRSS